MFLYVSNNHIQGEERGKKAPYKFFPCNFYKRKD